MILTHSFICLYLFFFKKKIQNVKNFYFINFPKFSLKNFFSISYTKLFKFIFFKLIIQFLSKIPFNVSLNKLLLSWRYQKLIFHKIKFKFNFKSYLKLFDINFRTFYDQKNKDFIFLKNKLYFNNIKLNFFFHNSRLVYSKLRTYKFFKRASFFRRLIRRKKLLIRTYRIVNFYYLRKLVVLNNLNNKFKTHLFKFVINFTFKRNNLFMIFSNHQGQVLKFLSAGRLTAGKKKVSTLTAKNLARIMSRLIFRILKATNREIKTLDIKPIFFISFIVNKLFYTPIIKTAIMTFKNYNVPIACFIDNIRLTHNKGLKRKKLRRV